MASGLNEGEPEPDQFREPNKYQRDGEIDGLIALMRSVGVKSYLEIGSKFGGSLWKIARALPMGSRVVSVDIVERESLTRCISALCSECYDALFINGDSAAVDTIERVKLFGPYDAVFIDGSHHGITAQSDWKHYGAMAIKLVALHDIKLRTTDVPQLWDSIKSDRKHQEIVVRGHKKDFGIGVLWV